ARVLVDDKGLAKGVQYFDRKTGQERQVLGKVVVMGASCVDTTRILLNSTSTAYPNGIGNGSDVIGRYLCEQVRIHARGFMPSLYAKAATDDKGIGGEHMYMPRFNHREGRKRDYLRGFGMQFWGCGTNPDGAGHFAGGIKGFGSGFKDEVRKRYPAWVELHPFGEVLSYADNRITVDKTKTDTYGVPLLHIDYTIRENERKMVQHMADTIEEIAKASGIELWQYKRADLDRNGSAIHEHGTCRMGDDPKKSALNKFNQMHEVKNLFVVDGSSFTTASEKNPTITILSIAWRATDYLAEEIKRGNL
ncbi:MAG TPA: GMC oxidoreductase, partial [Luteitalea sp.]|nr:GMC oxidoreductase [Luteitalea sp.]